MIEIDDRSMIGETFFRAADAYGNLPFLAVPVNESRAYHPQGYEIDFNSAATQVRELIAIYHAAGYGHGHRIALLLENRPEHYLHKLAMNAIGVCCVPINPDYRTKEIIFLLEHSQVDLVIVIESRMAQIRAALADTSHAVQVVVFENFESSLPLAERLVNEEPVTADTPASILYTSGTTGRPKGCVLSHNYELSAGAWYATRGFLAQLREGKERLYNPLPAYHVNASVLSFFCVLLTGNCQIQTDRFQPRRWWDEVCETNATVVHYLGVIVPLLLGLPESERERQHHVRFAIGAGVEPQLHAKFEERFGFPLIEVWGMTEIIRGIFNNMVPRNVGARAFGRATQGIEVRVVDNFDLDVAEGMSGEMLVRHSCETPRKGFFSCYLDDSDATETVWQGGWFHTGDIVTKASDGMLYFVDRCKNIIRRSGENIAAAEVEALLQSHPLVKQVAVLAVKDDLREEEVLACVVLAGGEANPVTARVLFDFCDTNLAYYKAPGWIWFTDSIPTTGTQKILKHQIFPVGSDPRTMNGIIDLRSFKKRGMEYGA